MTRSVHVIFSLAGNPKIRLQSPVPKSASNSRRLNNWTAVVFLAGRLFIDLAVRLYTTIPDCLKRRRQLSHVAGAIVSSASSSV